MKWKSRIALSHSAAMLRIKSLFFCTGSLAFTCDSTRPPSECKSTEIDLLCLLICRNNYFVVIGSVDDCLNPPYWLIICKNALIENDCLRLFRLNFVFLTMGFVKAKRKTYIVKVDWLEHNLLVRKKKTVLITKLSKISAGLQIHFIKSLLCECLHVPRVIGCRHNYVACQCLSLKGQTQRNLDNFSHERNKDIAR